MYTIISKDKHGRIEDLSGGNYGEGVEELCVCPHSHPAGYNEPHSYVLCCEDIETLERVKQELKEEGYAPFSVTIPRFKSLLKETYKTREEALRLHMKARTILALCLLEHKPLI